MVNHEDPYIVLKMFFPLAMPYSMWDLIEPVPPPVEMQSLND